MSSSSANRGVISQLARSQPRGQYNDSVTSSPARSYNEKLDDNENTGTLSTFQPEHESTQQYDTATQDQLPNLRSSASRYFHIDTGARDAFPDFTGHSPAHDLSESIELGRGVKRSAGNSPARAYGYEDMSENLLFNLGDDSLYELTGTPLRPALSARKSDNLRKEASLRRASTQHTKANDIVPANTRSTNVSNRRTLSDMHAKVRADSDSSLIAAEAVQPNAHARNTRFSRSRQTSGAQQTIPTRFTPGQGLSSGLDQKTPQRPTANATTTSATFTGNQTQQSFMLPDLPNITELVSGVHKDGTPVFSRTTKSRSRFTSASYSKPTSHDSLRHAQIHSIPLPEEEKAIFASLQLLKDKVAQLEAEKSEALQKLDEYETEVIDLKTRVQMEQTLRRPDSGLGSDEEASARDKWRMERSQLQASLKGLQDRLDRSDRKLSVSDIAVNRMTQERDNLVTQLGVAYYNSEELKIENEQLQSENVEVLQVNEELHNESEALRKSLSESCNQIARLRSQHMENADHWTKREAQLKSRIERRDEAVREMKDLTRDALDRSKPTATGKTPKVPQTVNQDVQQENVNRHRSAGGLGQETQNNIRATIEREISRARIEAREKAASSAAIKSNTPTLPRSRSRSKSHSREQVGKLYRRTSGQAAAAARADVETSEPESTTDLEISRPAARALREMSAPNLTTSAEQEDSKDITYLSFLDPNELAILRKTLEEERRAAKQSRAASAPIARNANDTYHSAAGVPRKSSLRDITAGLVADKSAAMDEDTARFLKSVRIQSPHASDAISYEEAHGITDASMLSTVSRRPQSKPFEEMTSAFILPDITLHTSTGPLPSAANTGIAHNKDTCTFCPTALITEPQDVPALVPVSTRDVDETNATIRPSQSAPVALATVLKQLEDEVTHLKMQLGALERAYGLHDPALGKRKRVLLKNKIAALIAEVERRSDQIYALYDVLEGQKVGAGDAAAAADVDAGKKGEKEREREMQEEVEETLQSLGIDAEDLALRAKMAKEGIKKAATKNSMDFVGGLDGTMDDSEEDLPWEGISDASDAESLDLAYQRRRSGVA